MVEIKAFVEVSSNVSKIAMGEGGCTYPITYKHGFCAGFLPRRLAVLLVYHF